MKTNFMRSLSAVLAVLLAMTLSFAVLADESSVATSEEASVESTVESSVEASAEESSAEESKESSSEASKETSKETSSEASKEESTSSNNSAATQEPAKDFPWARVITLIVIVVLVAVAIVLSKTNTAIGQKLAKFFKEYASEIKKVSWYSPKDTLKATAIVLVFIIVAALAIGLLDLGFTQIIKLIANIF